MISELLGDSAMPPASEPLPKDGTSECVPRTHLHQDGPECVFKGRVSGATELLSRIL